VEHLQGKEAARARDLVAFLVRRVVANAEHEVKVLHGVDMVEEGLDELALADARWANLRSRVE
jgi:hypothetical protein